jgi:hypothetical protein
MTNLRSVVPRIATAVAMAVLAAAALDAHVVLQESAHANPGFAAFQQRVEAYVTLHRTLAASLPPLGSRAHRQSVSAARKYLASAIKAARPNARQGDIFTSEATVAFRNVIADTMRASDFGMLAPLMDESGRLLSGAHPRVHDPFPVLESRELPPLMLAWLPMLPDELEYRIVDYDLALWDVYADLVVDVLPYALAHPRNDLMYR